MFKPHQKNISHIEEDFDLDSKIKNPKGFNLNSRATTAQSNVSRKKYRVTTVIRDRKPTIKEQNMKQDLFNKSQYTDRERNSAYQKESIKIEPIISKPKPNKSEITLNKLTMGFLNYDNLKEFYKEDKFKDPSDELISLSPRIKPKYNPDIDKDLNIFEFFNVQSKTSSFKLGLGSDGTIKRQSMDLTHSQILLNNEVFTNLL